MNKKNFGLIIILLSGLFIGILTAQSVKFSDDVMLYQVSLVGAVKNPGIFVVPASTRVSEVIKLSESEFFTAEMEQKRSERIAEEKNHLFDLKYEEYLYDPEAKPDLPSSQRNIILKRKNQEIQVDLLKYFTLGTDNMNPYVMDGDVIFVPSCQSEVKIFGAVNRAGNYELVTNDRISDLIKLALGCSENAYLEEAELARYKNTVEMEKISVNLEKALSDPQSGENLLLQSGDRLFVRTIPQFHENHFVTIAGEVDFPGQYPIKEGETTLLQILDQCGLNADKANFAKAFVQRFDADIDFDPEFERLKLSTPAQMNYLEYAYFKQKSRELRARFALDFKTLWETRNEEYDILLNDKDFIFIPQITNTVFVSGQVKNPGYQPVESAQNYKYYIENAGGFTKTARKNKIRIIKSDSGEWLKPSDELIISDGDIIFIPEKTEYEFLQISKDVLTILTQFATIILAIRTITIQ